MRCYPIYLSRCSFQGDLSSSAPYYGGYRTLLPRPPSQTRVWDAADEHPFYRLLKAPSLVLSPCGSAAPGIQSSFLYRPSPPGLQDSALGKSFARPPPFGADPARRRFAYNPFAG